MRQTIFVVEDDADIARLVRHHLESAGYVTRMFAQGTGVVEDAEKIPPALFLLDIMLPNSNGLDPCRGIHDSISLGHIPAIFVTAKTAETDRIVGLEIGADDYISKPFSPRELVARVRAVLRRFEQPLAPARIQVGEIEIDSASMTLQVQGRPVRTTATEFRLLEYLARHPGRVFSRDQILDAVWRDTSFVTPRSVDVYVRRLREKIEPEPDAPRYLKTLRGAGYRFEVSR